MKILYAPGKPIDRVLQAEIGGKISRATLSERDLPEVFQLFAQAANSVPAMRREMNQKRFCCQCDIGAQQFGVWVSHGGCTACQGTPREAAAVLAVEPAFALEILSGKATPQRCEGRLDYTGASHDALAFRDLLALFLDQYLSGAPAPAAGPASKLRFGVVGAEDSFCYFDRNDDLISFTAFYDENSAQAQAIAARRRRACVCDTLEALLASDIDAVLLLARRPAFALQCAKAGKHVLSIAPLAATPEGCRKLAAACEAFGVKCMEAQLQRFLPAHNYMRKIVRAGLIGEVRTVRAQANAAECMLELMEGELPGGALLRHGAGLFAALEFILGSACEEVTAALCTTATRLPEQAEDSAVAIARFASGAVAELSASFLQPGEPLFSMELTGSAGIILENHGWAAPVRFYSSDPRMAEDLRQWVEPELPHACPDWEAAAAREAATQFACSILEKKEPPFSAQQSARALSCVLAGYRSAKEGRAVEVAEAEALDEAAATALLRGLPSIVPVYGKHLAQLRVQHLPRERWQGYELLLRYEAMHYYDTELMECEDGLGVAFTLRAFAAPLQKESKFSLYAPGRDDVSAFGILENGALVGCVELEQPHGSRLRVTQLWVAEDRRRRGLGRALMEFAKAQGRAQGCRAMILETQSCNEAAIAFCQTLGLTLFGFDRSCYSNQDVENREVRLELGCSLESCFAS